MPLSYRLYRLNLRRWIPPLLTVLLFAVAAGLFPDLWPYRRQALLDGEVWRLLSAHFAHLGWTHALLNALGVLLVWLLFEPWWSPSRWWSAVLVVGTLTGVGLLALNPQLAWYVGFSGVLHGLFVTGALSAWQRSRDRLSLLVLLVVAAKLAWEQWSGGAGFSARLVGAPVVTDAHLYGALSGLFLGLILLFRAGKRGA